MKTFFVAGVIGLASTCLAVAIYKGAVPPIELKLGNLFTPAKDGKGIAGLVHEH